MRYLALLRGINVGGNNKIPMKDLGRSFETVGMEKVRDVTVRKLVGLF